MAKVIITGMGGGGGGASSDDCTATKDKVLQGYTAITKDSDDEPIAGTMKHLTQNTTIKHSVSNNTPVIVGDSCFISTNTDNVARVQIRYMDNGYISSNTLVGLEQSKVANACGLTAAKLLQGQSSIGINGTATSDANAVAADLRSGKTAYVKGAKITGTMTVNSVVSFNVATYSTSQVIATWTNPSKGPYSGFAICAKQGGYPTSIQDSRVYTGVGANHNLGAVNSITIGGLAAGVTYYFRIWVYCSTSSGDMYSGYQQAACATTAHGRIAFTTSGTWTVPPNVRSIDIHCTGGGAGGTQSLRSDKQGGGGGGGGYTAYKKGIAVTPDQQINYIVGSGGDITGHGNASSASINGTVIVSANGGLNGNTHFNVYNGGNGGSGGGGGKRGNDGNGQGGAGGADGGSGKSGGHNNFGLGQGTTTREFGDISGTLYSGGGGGGSWNVTDAAVGGAGGGGKGGGQTSQTYPVHAGNGSHGTGGGGGGGGTNSTNGTSRQGKGGSGNVIIRW